MLIEFLNRYVHQLLCVDLGGCGQSGLPVHLIESRQLGPFILVATDQKGRRLLEGTTQLMLLPFISRARIVLLQLKASKVFLLFRGRRSNLLVLSSIDGIIIQCRAPKRSLIPETDVPRRLFLPLHVRAIFVYHIVFLSIHSEYLNYFI